MPAASGCAWQSRCAWPNAPQSCGHPRDRHVRPARSASRTRRRARAGTNPRPRRRRNRRRRRGPAFSSTARRINIAHPLTAVTSKLVCRRRRRRLARERAEHPPGRRPNRRFPADAIRSGSSRDRTSGPRIPAEGRTRASARSCESASGARTTSLLTRKTHSAPAFSARSIPTLQPAGNPRLSCKLDHADAASCSAGSPKACRKRVGGAVRGTVVDDQNRSRRSKRSLQGSDGEPRLLRRSVVQHDGSDGLRGVEPFDPCSSVAGTATARVLRSKSDPE